MWHWLLALGSWRGLPDMRNPLVGPQPHETMSMEVEVVMRAFMEWSDRELVDLIARLRPAVRHVSLGRDLEPMLLDLDALRAAEAEMRRRGWFGHDGYWQRLDDFDCVLCEPQDRWSAPEEVVR